MPERKYILRFFYFVLLKKVVTYIIHTHIPIKHEKGTEIDDLWKHELLRETIVLINNLAREHANDFPRTLCMYKLCSKKFVFPAENFTLHVKMNRV